MSSHDDHDHHHTHQDHSQTQHDHGRLSEKEKLVKMVQHWLHHCDEHAKSYRDWAQRARAIGYDEVYAILEDVARETELQNRDMERIIQLLAAELPPR